MIILSAHARARSLRRGISRLQEVYVDESYIREHDSRQWSWFPDDELHAAIAAKASRGDRWSAIYAGTNDGWVEGSLYLAKANKALDTRAIVDADLFEDWFQRYLLSCLTKPSLIIFDNASFHRRCDVTLSRMNEVNLGGVERVLGNPEVGDEIRRRQVDVRRIHHESVDGPCIDDEPLRALALVDRKQAINDAGRGSEVQHAALGERDTSAGGRTRKHMNTREAGCTWSGGRRRCSGTA